MAKPKDKTTPKWWPFLTPEELAFAKEYAAKRECTDQMQKQYRRLYFRATKRRKRKKEQEKAE